ncbi:MAG: ABC transporter ATP-binding protein [Alphaproteobacteria bacterium]|nr:ABC transporter ATP-binding protein [Alphaproteobacteria bacterium]
MADGTGDTVLGLEGISRVYEQAGRSLPILIDVEFALGAGELVALVGPSGVGKSTLLHIAGLLERPTSGIVTVNGRSSADMRDAERTRLRRQAIGFVYQFHHLLPEFSALENVVLPQLIDGTAMSAAKKRARELLELVGLSARVDHRPAQLSGGEQQRVAIARAVANAPAVLLADEPTGNLDPHTADQVFDQLTELLNATGQAALIATHNKDLAARMGRTVTIEEGKVVPVAK